MELKHTDIHARARARAARPGPGPSPSGAPSARPRCDNQLNKPSEQPHTPRPPRPTGATGRGSMRRGRGCRGQLRSFRAPAAARRTPRLRQGGIFRVECCCWSGGRGHFGRARNSSPGREGMGEGGVVVVRGRSSFALWAARRTSRLVETVRFMAVRSRSWPGPWPPRISGDAGRVCCCCRSFVFAPSRLVLIGWRLTRPEFFY